MGEMNEVNGVLILTGMGIKKKGDGGEKKRAERVLKKNTPSQ